MLMWDRDEYGRAVGTPVEYTVFQTKDKKWVAQVFNLNQSGYLNKNGVIALDFESGKHGNYSKEVEFDSEYAAQEICEQHYDSL